MRQLRRQHNRLRPGGLCDLLDEHGSHRPDCNDFSKLRSNGSIYSALPTSNSTFYDVQVATINAYSLPELLRSTLSNSVAVNVSSSYIDLSLPSNVLLYYGGYPITAHLKNQNYTISNVTILKAPGTLVNVSISALVIPTNGTVYRNQISVRLT